jgi:hypothetical protein
VALALEKGHAILLHVSAPHARGTVLRVYHCSLYTTWQACRRVWRPGQALPVRVVFIAYQITEITPALCMAASRVINRNPS